MIAAGIACIPEGRKVFPKLTVEENLRLGAYQETSDTVTQERMTEIYRLFPRLAERRGQLAGTMSGGEQAMVSIGRGLMRAPKLLLIDEPSLGLSPLLVKENFNIIRQINERGITVFLVEQNMHQTLAISHYGYVLSKGRVVAAARPPSSLIAKRCATLILLKGKLKLAALSLPAAGDYCAERIAHCNGSLSRRPFSAILANSGGY